MPSDKSLFHYGLIYHRLFDPPLTEARQRAVDLIPAGSSVLDIGCGTGQLCFALSEQRGCRVVGIDLSLRMLEFARKSNSSPRLSFSHEDATDLRGFGDHSFDWATILMVMHELPMPQRVRILTEALRVAKRAIIIDSITPLPNNLAGVAIRVVEAVFGHDHNPNFKAFLATSGIQGILQESGIPITVEYSSKFWRNCREVLVVSKEQ